MKIRTLIIFVLVIFSSSILFEGFFYSDAFFEGGIVIELPLQTMEIQKINGIWYYVSEPVKPESYVDWIVFQNVVFTPPYKHEPPRHTFSDVEFYDGVHETIDILFDEPVFTKHVNPQAGFVAKPDGYSFLVSVNFKELSPLKQLKSGILSDKIICMDNLILVQKYDGSPACVTHHTTLELAKRGWGISYETLHGLVQHSDAIITGMVVGEDILPNGERHVWLGSYEWLKQGIYDDQSLFLEQSDNPQTMSIPFSRGEEVLLFLEDIDVKRGAYDIFSLDDVPPQKYSINLRDMVASMFDHNIYTIKDDANYKDDENCSLKLFGNDQYWYCTPKKFSYVPVETLSEEIRKKMLETISEKYLEEHFDLLVIFDEPDPVYEPAPNASPYEPPEKATRQNIEFTFSIDGYDFVYWMNTKYDEDLNQIFLQYIPPKEIHSIVNSEQEIDKMIYSCLDDYSYKHPYVPARVAYHTEIGFSPVMEGHGPPSVYDRWGDNPVQEREKVFRLWLETGTVDCAKVHHEFEPEYSQRHDNVLLIDLSQE